MKLPQKKVMALIAVGISSQVSEHGGTTEGVRSSLLALELPLAQAVEPVAHQKDPDSSEKGVSDYGHAEARH